VPAVSGAHSWPASANGVALEVLAGGAECEIVAVDFDALHAAGFDGLAEREAGNAGNAGSRLDAHVFFGVDGCHKGIITERSPRSMLRAARLGGSGFMGAGRAWAWVRPSGAVGGVADHPGAAASSWAGNVAIGVAGSVIHS
jgi:hypothetical protein